ncbi:kinase-like domain-containing protein [Gilbertella persicaria]|uniref:kinase-like domain-containing protein n=1 Tax=Gilbertella persicaria TaxID=101096 RepID=UPI00221F0FD9|nr:kinase-like domain-containing protein [Gilbertella persicaria]KAI8051377.1 kinase-like domain-containing protein [Gilbertella persicaria]
MPISNHKQKKTSWSQLKHILNQKAPHDQDIKDWKSLSPNKPPLPFLFTDPVSKHQSKDSTIPTQPVLSFSSSSRDLYPIQETSETNTSSSKSRHPAEGNMLNNASSSSDRFDLIISQVKKPNVEKILEEEYHHRYIPIPEWLAQASTCEPRFDPVLQYNEAESKTVFAEMVITAFDLFKKPKHIPKDMYLLFNENDNDMKGITIIMQNGTREDYLGFGGSLQYLAPELWTHSHFDYEHVEIWSLGISLFRMLIGRYPFYTQGLFDKEIYTRMTHCPEIPKQISKEARDLIQKMLSPEHNRASFDLILFHPWLKAHHIQKEPLQKENKKQSKTKRMAQLVQKIIRLVFKGPYPPPASYYDLVIINKRYT